MVEEANERVCACFGPGWKEEYEEEEEEDGDDATLRMSEVAS